MAKERGRKEADAQLSQGHAQVADRIGTQRALLPLSWETVFHYTIDRL